VTIAFTDIVGSTPMAERLGDRRWMTVLAAHDVLVRRHAALHGGYEVKSQGDGLMLAFGSARGAIEFAVAVQRELAWNASRAPEDSVRVRIGIHTGEAIRQGEDFFGRAVVVASRLVDMCGDSGIAVSEMVRDLTRDAGDLVFDDGREVDLRGLSGRHRLYCVLWSAGGPPGSTGPPTP
jgi:class 3 adenylate cyclase